MVSISMKNSISNSDGKDTTATTATAQQVKSFLSNFYLLF